MRAAALRLCATVAVIGAACTHKPAPGESIADACRLTNNGHEVNVSGYLQAPILVGCETKECSLQLTPTRKGTYGLTVRIRIGTGPSTMTPLPPSKKSEYPSGAITVEPVSLSVRDARGTSVRIRDVVRVTGVLSAYESGGELRCEVGVSKLESR